MLELRNKISMWLRIKWKRSLVNALWQDLTPLGRITLLIPIWISCYLMLPLVLLAAGVIYVSELEFWRKTAEKIPPLFFR